MAFYLVCAPRKLLPGPLVLGLAVWVSLLVSVAVLGNEAVSEDSQSAPVKESSLVSSARDTHVMVVGFMGGFVHHDDPHHPEVRLIRDLHEEYPTGAYFGLFENHDVDGAYRSIVRERNAGQGNGVSEIRAPDTQIILFGHSWGASAVVRLARRLDRAGIPVALTIQVDSVAKPFSNDSVIPPNVSEAVNFYQSHGLIRGRSRITAADGDRTRILGNFRREYRSEPPACRNFSWYSRLFTKGHISIECDPNLWTEIRALLEHYLPAETLAPTQLRSPKAVTPSPDAKTGEVGHREDLQSKPIGRNRGDGHCCN